MPGHQEHRRRAANDRLRPCSTRGKPRCRDRRQGDRGVLTVTWPKPVNSDAKATMTIHYSGNGALAITVVDAVHPGGPQAEVTRLAFNQL